ncbi:MAG: class I SAM-dependent methyltransferase [Planctomycetes bacterium]|nr:class I SAM-dependent methyltransferase [Planctomycetota bacterium]
MREAKARKIFRDGWSHPDRVDGWVNSQLYREFMDNDVRKAWKTVLRRAAGGTMGAAERAALDIGTGPGTIAHLWAELGFRTTGLDFSPAMLKAADKEAAERGLSIDLVKGDAESPPLQDSGFDIISSRFLLFTLPHPGYAIRRWMQLLREGGMLVLIGHDHPQNPERRGHHKQKKRRWHPSDDYRTALQQLPFKNHTSGELRVVMEAAGLRNIRSMPIDKVAAARAGLGQKSPNWANSAAYLLYWLEESKCLWLPTAEK